MNLFSVKTLQHSLQCSTYTQAITIELRIIIIILTHRVHTSRSQDTSKSTEVKGINIQQQRNKAT